MTATGTAPHPAPSPTAKRGLRRERFGPVLRAEWTKFRTVRGWVVGLLVAALLSVLFTFLVANGKHSGVCAGAPPPGAASNSPGSSCHAGHPFVPIGPHGQPVADSYQFVDRQLTGDGILSARVAALSGVVSTRPANVAPSRAYTRPGLTAWAKAGILLTSGTRQGSPYAAVMATGGHGIRWQYDYTHDRAGPPGSISGTAPRWLRLTRAGDTITGYDSRNGTAWTRIGVTHLTGLPATVAVGLFVTSPVSFHDSSSGSATLATARFDHVSLDGNRDGGPGPWRGRSIGMDARDFYPVIGPGGYRRAGSAFVVSGSGDIAPAVAEGLVGADTPASILLVGLIAGLIVMVVVATLFITVEYRRGLIRTSFTATPSRGRVLAAKVVVIGGVAFVTAVVSAAVAIPLGEHILTANGDYVFPVSAVTVLRVIAGSGAVVAVTAVGVLAVAAILRRSAGAVAAGIVVFVLPYILGQFLSGGVDEWLFRLTPAAGLDVLSVLPRSAQVVYPYNLNNGYYPLAPWAGFAVLCGYAAIAVGVAVVVLRRRDA